MKYATQSSRTITHAGCLSPKCFPPSILIRESGKLTKIEIQKTKQKEKTKEKEKTRHEKMSVHSIFRVLDNLFTQF
jgi:hypothetical protein